MNNTFEIEILEHPDVITPTQAHDTDAGYDVVCIKDPVIVGQIAYEDKESPKNNIYSRIDYIQYHTAVHLGLTPFVREKDAWSENPPKVYFHCNLKSRSSVRKYNLVLANGVGLADPEYTGEYLFCFKYIFQPEDFVFSCDASGSLASFVGCKVNHSKIYQKSDAIGQLEFQKTYFAKFNSVKALQKTQRGDKGFGSSDRK